MTVPSQCRFIFAPRPLLLNPLALFAPLSFRSKNRLLGASSPSQLEVNLKDIEKGPLPQDLVEALEESWESLKDSSFGVNPH